MLTSLKQLLSSIVDYAGLFPPAQLSLPEAMTVYDRALASPHAWMLDRFVLPAARLPEFCQLLPSVRAASSRPWNLSVLLSQQWELELAQVQQTIAALPHDAKVAITALEVAPLSPAEIPQVCQQCPVGSDLFFEIPFDRDLEPYLAPLHQTGSAAKLRTGGITQAAFPSRTHLSQRILALASAHIPFKATAGLHHPLPGTYALTEAAESDRATMHGFLNVALVAAFVQSGTWTIAEATALLEESPMTAFHWTETEVRWRDRTLSLTEIAQARQQGFRGFGSCSFQVPIDDLHHLHLL